MNAPLGTRTVGGPTVSSPGPGRRGPSRTYGPADRSESVATTHRAPELGATFLDTSDVCGDSPERAR